eukprot:2880559-Ditylum_brightwellii.AAC.1
MFETLKEKKVDIGVLPESNTPWTPDRLSKYRKLGVEVFQHFKLKGTSSDEACVRHYQPGGVALFAGGNAVGRISKLGVYFCLNGQYNKKIWIVGAYRLGNNKSTGDDTVYQQQGRLLTQQGKENPGPSLEWDKDTVSFLNSIPAKDKIIVAMNENGDMEDPQFTFFLASTRLVDMIGTQHG